MKRLVYLLLTLACITVFLGILAGFPRILSFGPFEKLFSSVFFVESTTTESLRSAYTKGQRIRVLIVPGHDREAWGTEFRGVKEADMNAVLGEELAMFLSGDGHFEPILVRTRSGYAKEFEDYFQSEAAAVRAFVANKKQVMKDLLRRGLVEREDGGVVHNDAPSTVAYRLYSINKWANEHSIDLVIHIHFNDYPGRRRNQPGKYEGFSIYVPDEQYSNAKPSRALADVIAGNLSVFFAPSNLPTEGAVVPDQELIAIGSFNTLDPAGLLIEYGYIYEPQFLDATIRGVVIRELAFQTYLGLNRFFGNRADVLGRHATTLLPHTFERSLTSGMKNLPEILSLQAALIQNAAYPPTGEDLHSCPMSGSFGPCTLRAVQEFQNEYGLPKTGVTDEFTRTKLNELYGM